MVKMFDMNFQISPLGKTQFRSVDASFDTEVKFEKQDQNKPLLIHVEIEGEKPITFEAIQLVSPTSTQLSDYVGDYYSDELQFTYKLVMKDGKLFFRHRNALKKPLSPTLKDMFKVSYVRIQFVRDRQNRISAFNLSSERTRNIRFAKKRVE
jgi:uncharacterized membrane protein (UPF0182 family)